MENSIYSATLGSIVEQKRFELLANNLANINTPGFKADRLSNRAQVEYVSDDKFSKNRVEFKNLLKKMESKTSFEQGPLRQTNNKFDLALEGPGFFAVQTPWGISYTRAGNFRLDAEGTLVTAEGFQILGEGGPIQIESSQDFTVTPEGIVISQGTEVDRFSITEFERPDLLTKTGSTLFNAPREAGVQAAESTKIHQGSLEEPNTNMIKLLAEMIHAQRSFETYQRIIKMSDELVSKQQAKIIGEG